jgi:HD domain-containing protein
VTGDPGAATADRAEELVPGFSPENETEEALTRAPELLAGLAWGKPREAHPEGPVGMHVAQLLDEIDRSGEQGERRTLLRFIAILHDAFKYRVRNWLPRAGFNHHAMRARRFAERFTDDDRLLATIELHDRPYALWKKMRRNGRLDERPFEEMLGRIPDHELFLRFVEIDGASEAKTREPIEWLREELERRGLV